MPSPFNDTKGLLLSKGDGACEAEIALRRGGCGITEQKDARQDCRQSKGSFSPDLPLLHDPAAEERSRDATDGSDHVMCVGCIERVIRSCLGGGVRFEVDGQKDVEEIVANTDHAPNEDDDCGRKGHLTVSEKSSEMGALQFVQVICDHLRGARPGRT